MKSRELKTNIYWIGAVDWDRRLFDELIPLPDGTSYNAYLIKGSKKTCLIDTVDPTVTTVHWLTILLIFLAGSTMLSAPLKETPMAAIIALLAFGSLVGVFLLIADFSTDFSNPEVLGIVNIPLSLVILIIVVIVGVVFLITFFTEFTVDRVLQLISWAPVVILFCALLAIQGLLIVLLPDAGGIWELLP